MALTLREIAGANFRTSEESDTVNTDFMEHLGSRTRYLPARLAIGRSLRVAASPPAVEQSGKTIKGETLFGDELGPWLAMLTEHDGREDIALRGLQAIVAAHWARGIGMLQRDWAAAGQDRDRLLRKLAEDAGLSPTLAAVSGDEQCLLLEAELSRFQSVRSARMNKVRLLLGGRMLRQAHHIWQ